MAKLKLGSTVGGNLIATIKDLNNLESFKKQVYGVKIDTTNSNPKTAVTYIEDSTYFNEASGNNGNFSYGSWEDKFPFSQIKPCVFKDGKVNYYINPNDYTKRENGLTADITSGNDGDVMIEFPKIYWKFEAVGTDLYIRYSNRKVDEGYRCLAHIRETEEIEYIYLSAYMGTNLNSKLSSLSGLKPFGENDLPTFRNSAQSKGKGYEISTYFQMLMLQILFVIMFKNRDSQTALGRGCSDNTEILYTGGTDKKGMFYGETTGMLQNKFCGIEDFWGNTAYWIDGMFCDKDLNILINNNNFNKTGDGYTNYGKASNSNISGVISEVQGGTETGFIIKKNSGSTSTYYTDLGIVYGGYYTVFGGSYNSGYNNGVFRMLVDYGYNFKRADVSARLSYY